jgi:hypothetical protein
MALEDVVLGVGDACRRKPGQAYESCCCTFVLVLAVTTCISGATSINYRYSYFVTGMRGLINPLILTPVLLSLMLHILARCNFECWRCCRGGGGSERRAPRSLDADEPGAVELAEVTGSDEAVNATTEETSSTDASAVVLEAATSDAAAFT